MDLRFMQGSMQIQFLLAILYCSCLTCQDNPNESKGNPIPEPPGGRLVWNDEFNGKRIDKKKWTHEINGRGGGNRELQYYTDRLENSYIEDGSLVIQALKENYTGPDGFRQFTSARLTCRGKAGWKYGRFDIRAKLPAGKGLWPAIWMMPVASIYGGWAASGEIDIMELLGHEPAKMYGTLHYGGTYPNNKSSGKSYTLPAGAFNEDFHLFTLEWEAGEMRWFVDSVLVQTQTEWYTSGAEFPAPFDQEFYFILNVAVGGNWPGSPDLSTHFPQQMAIDYIRVFSARE